MSLRFFTNTKTGELMSRLNNDVGGAQRAVTGTIVDLITNVVTLGMTLAIMLRLEWRLTLLARGGAAALSDPRAAARAGACARLCASR